MNIYLDESKPYFKANMHTHTTNSDGKATPEKIKEEYMKRGYSVVAFTDHDYIIPNPHLTDENFLAITSYELEVMDDKEVWGPITRQRINTAHLNMYALCEDNITTLCMSLNDKTQAPEHALAKAVCDGKSEMKKWDAEHIRKIVDYAHENGFLVCYNHPSWSLEYEADYLNYGDFDFIEVFNTGCYRNGIAGYDQALDVCVKNGKIVGPIAADDCHNIFGFEGTKCDSFGGWIMINAEKLDYETIMNAIKNRKFYASCGPEIHSIIREGDEVTITTSPVRLISRQTEGRQSGALFAEDGELITTATFPLKENEKYFRFTIEDEKGYKAWSQVYEVNEE